MSRAETMTKPKWRVQVRERGYVTHESMFKSYDAARSYYTAVFVLGAEKVLSFRDAGASRFAVLRNEVMNDPTGIFRDAK
jgi:hypothetical protein